MTSRTFPPCCLAALLTVAASTAHAQHAAVSWTSVPQATAYRVYQNGTPTDVGNVTTATVPLGPLPATFAVTAVNSGGESGRSNELVLAQAAATATPSVPTQLSVAYRGSAIDNGPYAAPFFSNEHLGSTNAADVETPLPRPALFTAFTVQSSGGPPWDVAYHLATDGGNPRVLGCTAHPVDALGVPAGTCTDTGHVVAGSAFSLYVDNTAADPNQPPVFLSPQTKVTLLNPDGSAYDTLVTLGGNHNAAPQWLLDGTYFGPDGWVSGTAQYGNQPSFDDAAITVPVPGVSVTGLAAKVSVAIEPDAVETYTVELHTNSGKRDALSVTLAGGDTVVRQPTCSGCGLPQFSKFAVRYNCTRKGLPCAANNQPTLGHFRNLGLTLNVPGGFLYAVRSFLWGKNPPPTNTAYAYWMCETLGLDQGGTSCSFLLPDKGEFVSDMVADTTLPLGQNERIGVCTSLSNTFNGTPCSPSWGATLAKGQRFARGDGGVLSFQRSGYWSLFMTPEPMPMGSGLDTHTVGVSFVVRTGP